MASPLYIREREESEGQARAYHSERESLMIRSSRNPEVSGKPDAECVQKWEASAQRTQAYHSRRECLMTNSSRDLEVSGKPDAVFSCHYESSQNTFSKETEVTNRETSSRVVFILLLWPSNVGRCLLDGNKDHSLNQARSEIMKQEQQVGSLNICIDELQQQALCSKIGFWRTLNTDMLSVDENNLNYKKKALRETQIRNTHEMGEMKRAQELRVDEVSVQTLMESHETKAHFTNAGNARILWMTEENFKKWNRITVGECLSFPVNQQRFQVLVPCWAATNACHLTHGIRLDYRKTFLVINFLQLIRPKKSFSKNSSFYDTRCCRIGSSVLVQELLSREMKI